MREVGLMAEAGEGWYARRGFRCGAYWGGRRRGDKRWVVEGRGGGIVLELGGGKIAAWSLRRNVWSCDTIDSRLGSDVISTVPGSMEMQIVS